MFLEFGPGWRPANIHNGVPIHLVLESARRVVGDINHHSLCWQ